MYRSVISTAINALIFQTVFLHHHPHSHYQHHHHQSVADEGHFYSRNAMQPAVLSVRQSVRLFVCLSSSYIVSNG